MTAFVEANGLRFAYLADGPADGPLVLLVHGFPDTAHTWSHALPALAAAGYRAVAPFTRGYAPTAIPHDGRYDTETLGDDVLALAEALSPRAPAIVIGHDWGASAAFAAAARGGPAKLRLLVTLAIPHPRSIRPSPALAWKVRHFVALRRAGAAATLARDDFALVDALWRRWSPAWAHIPASETAAVKAAFREPGCAEAAVSYYRALTLTLPAALRAPIEVPSIAFAGEHDMIAPRAYEKARHCYRGPYQVIQVPGGHFMHREHPEDFTRELVGALRDFEARRG